MIYKTIKNGKKFKIEGYNEDVLTYEQSFNSFTGAPFMSEEECEQYKKDMGLTDTVIEETITTEEQV